MSEQGTHHFVMSVQKPQAGGFAMATWSGDFTPPPGSTRRDAYGWLCEQFDREYPDLARGVVIFFSLEPNTL